MHIFQIPHASIKKIESITAICFWSGSSAYKNIPLDGLNIISRIENMGGWRIQNIKSFNQALLMTNIWCMFRDRGLWHSIMMDKKIPLGVLEVWIAAEPHQNPTFQSYGEA